MSETATELTPIADIEEVLSSESRRRRRSRCWLALLLLLGLGLLALLVARGLRPTPPVYEQGVVSRTDLEITVTAVGTIEPLDEVEVGSELSGVLLEVLVDEGESVEAGQVLAKLDPALLKAQVAQARAQVAAAQAGVSQLDSAMALAQRNRDIASELAERGAQAADSSAQASSAHEQAVAARDAATAQLRAARAALSLAELNLAKSVIKAPISGVVLSRSAEVGQSVVSTLQAQTLFVIAQDLGMMQVVLDIDEADIARVRAGQEVRFTVAAFPQRTFEGTLVRVGLAPKPMRTVVTYEALVAVTNEDKALVPGMTANATIVADRRPGILAVPNAALRFRPNGVEDTPRPDGVGRLWVLDGNSQLQPIPVELGATNGRMTEVTGPLADGASIVLSESAPE